MISAGFQKYVEAMNQQPLDKKPERQSAGKLLPHQRRGVSKEHVAAEELKAQAITKSSDTENLPDTLQQGVSSAAPSALMKSGSLPGKNSSSEHSGRVHTHQSEALSSNHQPQRPKPQLTGSHPHRHQVHLPTREIKQHQLSQNAHTATVPGNIKNGLAKSRWASPSYNFGPVDEVCRSPPIPQIPMKNEKRETIGKEAATLMGLTPDTLAKWRAIGKPTHSAWSIASHPILESNPFSKEYNKDPITTRNDPVYTHDTALGTLGDTENKTFTSGFQSLVAVASVASTGDKPETTTKHASSPSQAEELGTCEPKFNDALLDPRGNWPAAAGSQEEPRQCVANSDRDWTLRHETKSSDIVSSSGDKVAPKHMTDFIRSWIQDTHVVDTTFLRREIDNSQTTDLHEDCDIDTYEGRPMTPIDYPKTRKQELMSRRQSEETSATAMRQFAAEIARRDPNVKLKQKESKRRAAAMATEAMVDREPEPLLEEPNPNEIQIPCHLRPAYESDIEAITAIYNHEIASGYKVMDTSPVGHDDFHNIYSECLVEKMPFVVAVEGSHEVIEKYPQRIIGFALITAVCRGISGSYETLSRPGGKLLVIVKPEYRRKKVGTALLDILITNCTGWYVSKGGYQFVNFTHDWMSTEFRSNTRLWWYLEMEVMIRSGETEEGTRNSEEFQWIWNFLEAKFNLLLKHYDEKCFYEPRQMIWLDKLTFRRVCRTLGT
ncbi:hypothetical protein F5B17DRAFT_431135 [Nemania serpens]|nr:hypothetical protein F5B17DRAFT_431135 [Nemania serpens]